MRWEPLVCCALDGDDLVRIDGHKKWHLVAILKWGIHNTLNKELIDGMDGISFDLIHMIQNTLSRNPLFVKHKNINFKKISCWKGIGMLNMVHSKSHISKRNNFWPTNYGIFCGGNESSIVRVVGAKRIPLAKKRPQSIDTSPQQLPCFMPSLGGTPLTIHKKSPQVASSIGGGKGGADLKMTLFPICLKISFVQNNTFKNIF